MNMLVLYLSLLVLKGIDDYWTDFLIFCGGA